MTGKRHANETNIRIFWEYEGSLNIMEVSKEHIITEVIFNRSKLRFGQLDLNEARPINEL